MVKIIKTVTGNTIALNADAASEFKTATGDLLLSSTIGSVNVTAGEAVTDAIKFTGSNAASGIQLDCGSAGIQVKTDEGIFMDEPIASGSNTVQIATQAMSTNWKLTLPADNGDTDEFLQTDGSGTTTWAAAGGSELPAGYITGLITSDATVSTKSISAGRCRDSTNTFDIISSGVLTPDVSVSGPAINGRDSATAEAADTWYAIFVIADTAAVEPVASLLSTSATSPTLPTDYDVFRRIGWVRNDGSSDFYNYESFSTGRDRFYLWRETQTVLEILTSGAATTFADIDLSEFVPPTCTLAYIIITHAGTANNFVSFRPNGSSLDPVSHRAYSAGGQNGDRRATTCFFIETDSSQVIEYENNTGTTDTDLSVIAFTDSI